MDDLGVEEVIDQVTEDVSLDHCLDLVSKFELGQDGACQKFCV